MLHGPLETLLKTFNEVGDGAFEREVGPLADLPAFVKRLAVDNFIADDDGFLGRWGPNNLYVYRQQGQTACVIFPWDKDLAFWAPADDTENHVENNVLATRALSVPSLYRVYVETQIACAKSSMEPASAEDPTG